MNVLSVAFISSHLRILKAKSVNRYRTDTNLSAVIEGVLVSDGD